MPPDPAAWRRAVLVGSSAQSAPLKPKPRPRVTAEVQQQRSRPPPRMQRETHARHQSACGSPPHPHSRPVRQPAPSLSEEHLQQPVSLPLPVPIPVRNFYGPLQESTEEMPDRMDQHDRQRRNARTDGQLRGPSEHRAQQRPQAQMPLARNRRGRPTCSGNGSAVGRQGVLSDQPEFQMPATGSIPSSPPPPERRTYGWCRWSLPRSRTRGVASDLSELAEDGPLSCRIPAWGRQQGADGVFWACEQAGPLSGRVVRVMKDPWGDPGNRGGTAHRVVRWGHPPMVAQDSAGASGNQARNGTLAHSPGVSARGGDGGLSFPAAAAGRNSAGWPSATQRTPPLARPEGGEGANARGGQGSGEGSLLRMRSTSPVARPGLNATQDQGAISTGTGAQGPSHSPTPSRTWRAPLAQGRDKAPPRPGAEQRLPQAGPPTESRSASHALVHHGQERHAVTVTRADWEGFDHARHGASPDLVVALCLRQHLGCSELVSVELVSRDAMPLHRRDWPESWEEFGSFVASEGSFRVVALLRGGMDPSRKALLDAVPFGSDTDWSLLDQCLEAVRRQAPLPAEVDSEYRTIAELMAESTPLRQWALMEGAPEIQGRCNATPARMTALGLLLGRQSARVRPLPPCVAAGQAGQQIELRFNSIPPPPAPASGSAVSADTIKDWILDTLEALAPAMCTDPAFVLRVVRRSMRLEGNVSALQTFSLTVLLPFGDWITAFLRGQLSLGPGSYCTVAPFGTHIEAELTPRDHAVFRAIRLSLGLSHADSLALLENGLTRALRGPVVCRFTTSRRINNGGGGGGGGKPLFVHHSPDEEGASTLFTIEASSLVLARRQHLHVILSLGIGEDQRPLSLKIQLPVCPQGALYRMVGSRATPPLRIRVAGTLFMSPYVLIGPLATGWMTDQIEHSSSEEERLRRGMAEVWRVCVQAADLHFVGRRDKGDRNPMFIYIEFPGLDAARAFGANLDSKSFRQEFVGFWNNWIGDRPCGVWSCALLMEAMDTVNFKSWKGLMELGTQSPCPPPDPGADAAQ